MHHLERLIRQDQLNEEVLRALERFRRGRVRKAFLDSIASARRLYVLGHAREAAEQWLNAARWLPSGPERTRLRQIAAEASRGRLKIDVQQLGLADMTEAEAASLLRVSQRTLGRWRVEGGGPAFRRFGRRIGYAAADLHTWADTRRYRSTSAGDAAEARR